MIDNPKIRCTPQSQQFYLNRLFDDSAAAAAQSSRPSTILIKCVILFNLPPIGLSRLVDTDTN